MNPGSKLLLSLLFLAGLCMPPAAGAAGRTAPRLLGPEDLIYLGAFAAPESVTPPEYNEWSYGGSAMSYRSDGDPEGDADGFPGSLFISGNSQQDLVGEISIPAPVTGGDFSALTRATILQAPADITGGLLASTCTACSSCDCVDWDIGGLDVLEDIDRVAWTIYDWYNVAAEDLVSLGWSMEDMSSPSGVWHIGPRPNELSDPFHNAKTSDYLLEAPPDIARDELGGRSLLSGYHRESGALGGSQGPTLFASAPWLDGSPPAAGSDLDAIPLFYYRWFLDCTENDYNACDFEGYRVDDQWGGGAWIDTGEAEGILIFGLKGLGANCYGDPGAECPSPACDPGRGYHSDPYEPRILFYDPRQVLEIVAGSRNPWDIQPYLSYSPKEYLFDPDCGVMSAVAFDRGHQLIYVAEREAGEWGDTAIHVWKVRDVLFADGFEAGNTDRWGAVVPTAPVEKKREAVGRATPD